MRRSRRGLFLSAYALSGLAGLIYEVSWTRLLTLYMGHTTAAASAVVAAFMGGLAAGAAVGGNSASRLTRSQCLYAYIGLECLVVFVALLLPFELAAVTPLLRAAYHDGSPGLVFPAVRLLSCLVMMFVPAAGLGATFPVAVRWYLENPDHAGPTGGALYAVNTAGAAVGALVAGLVLIPAVGVAWTTRVGVMASVTAIAIVIALVRRDDGGEEQPIDGEAASTPSGRDASRAERRRRVAPQISARQMPERRWLGATVLGLTGFASLIFEITWTRVLSLTIGPTIYAFAATLAVLIGGMAFGSAMGAWAAGRTHRPAVWLALLLAASAAAAGWACSLAGGEVPRLVAEQVARAPEAFDLLLTRGAVLVAVLVLPTAAGLGAAFPLAFAMIGPTSGRASSSVTRRLGAVYAVNTLGAVAGSLLAGFVFIPLLGLQHTLDLVSAVLAGAALVVATCGQLSGRARAIVTVATAVSVVMLVVSPPWDRALLAGGGYLYAPYAPKDVDLEAVLKAGTLLYYREGAVATVSVKRLTGTVSLAVDGKVDASTGSDMLTQRIIAHLPLLLHEHPRDICIIGLGSGVTLGSALRHPIERADVVELSGEVVQASGYFAAENHRALEDPRTRLIVGDGRSHLLLSKKQYDVIVSEPSNPWIAGVASLFTREFFAAARDRLAPGGIICQWAHTYNIRDRDLRSIVATFMSVFPNGTAWLVGDEDVLLVASALPLDSRLANIESGWRRPGVAADLAEVGAVEPFALWSLFVGGPEELRRYTEGAAVFTDDLSSLEFSAPRELHGRGGGENASRLLALRDARRSPPTIRRVLAEATASNWRNRGAMSLKSNTFTAAYDDYARALSLDPSDTAALDGLVQAATMTERVVDALERVKALVAEAPRASAPLVAESKLLAASGSRDAAVAAADEAARIGTDHSAALEQLASLFADASDVAWLDTTVDALQREAPARAPTFYYAAVSAFLHGRSADAVTQAERAVSADPQYAPVYDLLGAAETKLDQPKAAREAFETSLRFNAHDSSAYANLGLLELAAADNPAAARDFAQALWLDPGSNAAREGLARAQTRAVE